MDLLAVAFHRWQQGLKLNHQRQQKFRFGSNHVWGTGKLRLIDLLPKLVAACLAEMMVALEKWFQCLRLSLERACGVGYCLRKSRAMGSPGPKKPPTAEDSTL